MSFNKQYIEGNKDKAIDLLDKLYIHTTERINNTLHEIEETLKQCQIEQDEINNFDRIKFDPNHQQRKSFEFVLKKRNNYIYHYCILFNHNESNEEYKLVIKCNCNSFIDL